LTQHLYRDPRHIFSIRSPTQIHVRRRTQAYVAPQKFLPWLQRSDPNYRWGRQSLGHPTQAHRLFSSTYSETVVIAYDNNRWDRKGTWSNSTSPISLCFLSNVRDTLTSEDATTSTDTLQDWKMANTCHIISLLLSLHLTSKSREWIMVEPQQGSHIGPTS
jgi:hypothetical protein